MIGKAVWVAVVVACVACVMAMPSPSSSRTQMLHRQKPVVQQQMEQTEQQARPRIPARFVLTRIAKPTGQVDHCGNCVAWAENAMEDLVQALFDLTFDACKDLCSQLPGQAEASICNALCDVVGVKEFIKIINEADLDPIYYCQLMKKCEFDDGGSGKLVDTNIVPRSGQRGNVFSVNVTFEVYNKTGAGEFLNIISAEDGSQQDVETGALFDYLDAGSYQGYVQFGTNIDKQNMVTWHSGRYHVQTYFCMGECFSNHPHSKTFNYHNSTFTLANSSDDDDQDDGPI